MSFSRHTSRIYMDQLDVDGTLNVLGRRITVNAGTDAEAYYVGAHLLLNLINNHEELRDQSVVMMLFDQSLANNGIDIRKDDE